MAVDGRANETDSMRNRVHSNPELTAESFQKHKTIFEKAFRAFVRAANTGLDETLSELWKRLLALDKPFWLDADLDMAKCTFLTGRGLHICTNPRRFHRPKKTGKVLSVTIYLGGHKREFDDPENQLTPCGTDDKLDCCYFGMGVDEADLALFYFEQLVTLKPLKKYHDLRRRSKISLRHSL